MKNKKVEETRELLFKIVAIVIISISCLVLFYTSIKWTSDYFTKTDEQICQISNSTLVNGQCHSAGCNFFVNDKREFLLVGAISFSIIAILLIICFLYNCQIEKNKLKEK